MGLSLVLGAQRIYCRLSDCRRVPLLPASGRKESERNARELCFLSSRLLLPLILLLYNPLQDKSGSSGRLLLPRSCFNVPAILAGAWLDWSRIGVTQELDLFPQPHLYQEMLMA